MAILCSCAPISREERFPNHLRRILAHQFSALSAIESSHVRPEEFQIITQLGHRSNRGTGRFNRIPLLDGDCRGNAFDSIDLWLVHSIEELPRIGGKRFDVPPLTFSKKRVKGQGAFSRSAQACKDDEFAHRQIQIEVFQVVMPHTAQTDRWRAGRALHHASLNVAAACQVSKGTSLRSFEKNVLRSPFLSHDAFLLR